MRFFVFLVVRVIKDPRCGSDYRTAVGQSQSLEFSQVSGPVAQRARCSWITRSENLTETFHTELNT